MLKERISELGQDKRKTLGAHLKILYRTEETSGHSFI